MKNDTITAKSKSFEEMTSVKFESFEEIDEERNKNLENIQNWNNAMRVGNGSVYKTTLAEELGTDNLPYMGIVHGKRIIFES